MSITDPASSRSACAKRIGIPVFAVLAFCIAPPFCSVASAAQDSGSLSGILAAESAGYLPKQWTKAAAVAFLPIALPNYDFVPLILKTSYGAREVTDWILQAKLCVRCGDAVASLRQQGIRGMHDLAGLCEEDLEPLANETAATLSSLKRAWKLARTDPEVQRLQEISGRVARFTQIEDLAQERGFADG